MQWLYKSKLSFPKFKIGVQIPWRGVSPKTMKNTAEVCPAAGGAKPPESETLEDTGYEDDKQSKKTERGDRNLLQIS